MYQSSVRSITISTPVDQICIRRPSGGSPTCEITRQRLFSSVRACTDRCCLSTWFQVQLKMPRGVGSQSRMAIRASEQLSWSLNAETACGCAFACNTQARKHARSQAEINPKSETAASFRHAAQSRRERKNGGGGTLICRHADCYADSCTVLLCYCSGSSTIC